MSAGGWMTQPGGLLMVLSAIAALPFAFLALTAFVKIATVLQIVRGAIGVQSVPSNAVILALSGALTLVAMAPVAEKVMIRLDPVLAQPAAKPVQWLTEVKDAVVEPLRTFLTANASEREKHRFASLMARHPNAQPAGLESEDLRVVVPAFLVTELLRAFTLGFAIYLPFLVIDLVVANVLVGLGMASLQPNQVSLPFKLLLFVATDGWGVLAETLVAGYLV